MNKVTISKRPEPVLLSAEIGEAWKEYILKKEDINETLLKIIYDREDVDFVLDYMENHFQHDNRRKYVYMYVNKDVDGLKNFMQYVEYAQDEPEILE